SPSVDATLTTRPASLASRSSRQARTTSTAPVRFTASVRSHVSGYRGSPSVPPLGMPAALIRMSTGPCRPWTRSTPAATDAASLTSTGGAPGPPQGAGAARRVRGYVEDAAVPPLGAQQLGGGGPDAAGAAGDDRDPAHAPARVTCR